MKKRFLLCIGCQKGGTTWLCEYLRDAPEVRVGVRKEMHVLDVYFLEAARDWHTRRIKMAESDLGKLGFGEGKLKFALTNRIARHRKAQSLTGDLDDYARYFREIADEDGVEVVADLTPDYALLGPEHWRIVREKLEAQGFEVKVLFLMREPLGRLESVYRMAARNAIEVGERGSGKIVRTVKRLVARGRHVMAQVAPEPTGERFLAFVRADRNLARTQYENTIAAVEAVFPPEDIRFDFYETLFRPESVAAINDFIGAANRPADFDERVNASPLQVPIAESERAEVRQLLEPTYRFCADRFGEDRIRAIWKRY